MISKEKKENEVKLTKLAQCSGCGAKVGAGVLQELLGDLKIKRDDKEYVCDKVEAIGIVATNDDAYLIKQTYDCYKPYGWKGAEIYKNKLNTRVDIEQIKGKYFII